MEVVMNGRWDVHQRGVSKAVEADGATLVEPRRLYSECCANGRDDLPRSIRQQGGDASTLQHNVDPKDGRQGKEWARMRERGRADTVRCEREGEEEEVEVEVEVEVMALLAIKVKSGGVQSQGGRLI